MTEGDRSERADDERRKNRPYRRLLTALFVIIVSVLCLLTLRGIVRTLDRLPSVDRLHQPEQVDARALAACAEDLLRLEEQTRTLAARALTEPAHAPREPWAERTRELEVERLRITARCRLSEASDDTLVNDLAQAASAVEALTRTYGLLYDRYRTEGQPRSLEAAEALSRARAALKERH